MKEISVNQETSWQRLVGRAFAMALALFLLFGLGLLLFLGFMRLLTAEH